MRKAVFTIGEEPKAYIGYTSGRLWNGWATPYFELEEAKRVVEDFNKCAEYPILYDEGIGQFFIAEPIDETKEFKKFTTLEEFIALGSDMWEFGIEDKWIGEDIHTSGGIKKLYGIGAYSWVWDEVTDIDCRLLAEGIEDFLWEYDTYEHKDQYADREELVEGIENQLRELKTFQRAYEVWHSEELSQDDRFEELRKLLTI